MDRGAKPELCAHLESSDCAVCPVQRCHAEFDPRTRAGARLTGSSSRVGATEECISFYGIGYSNKRVTQMYAWFLDTPFSRTQNVNSGVSISWGRTTGAAGPEEKLAAIAAAIISASGHKPFPFLIENSVPGSLTQYGNRTCDE